MKTTAGAVRTVIQVLPNLNAGGVEKTTIELANYLSINGIKSVVVCAPNGSYFNQLHRNVIIEKHKSIASKNPLKIIANIWLMVRIIKKHEAQIVHARSRAPAWSCYFAVKFFKGAVKFITTFHGTYSISGRFKKKYNHVMTRGNRVIAVSNFIKQHIIDNYKIDSSKIELIRCGVTIEKYDPSTVQFARINKILNDYNLPTDKKIILLPARLTSIKGHMFVLDTIKALNNDDAYFVFAGNFDSRSSYYRNLLKKIFELNIVDKIKIIRNVTDIQALYMCSYCTISPSIKPESFGRTIVESQAMGKPVIVSDIGAPRECIVQYKNGLIFKSQDVKSFTESLEWVLNLTTEEYIKISKDTRQIILENTELHSMREKTLELYNKVYNE